MPWQAGSRAPGAGRRRRAAARAAAASEDAQKSAAQRAEREWSRSKEVGAVLRGSDGEPERRGGRAALSGQRPGGGRLAGKAKNAAFFAPASSSSSSEVVLVAPSGPRPQGGGGGGDASEAGGAARLGSLAARQRSARSSGTLDLSRLRLRALTCDTVRGSAGEGEQWWSVAALTELRLSENELSEVEAGALEEARETLENLLLDHNAPLREVPRELWELPALKRALLSHLPALAELPAALRWPELVVLAASHSGLAHWPAAALGGMSRLHTLELSHCRLRELAGGALPPRLEKLSLADNALEWVDEAALSGPVAGSLRLLDLSRNRLERVPAALSELSRLEVLDLRHNKLRRLGAPLPRSPALDQVLLGFNELCTVEDLGLGERAPALTVLALNDNKLVELPGERLVRCAALKMLEVSNNDLAELPVALGYMPRLQGLNAVGNPLRGVRYQVLQAGTDKLKAFLRTRGPCPAGGAVFEPAEQPGARGRAATAPGPVQTPLQALLAADGHEALRDAVAVARATGALKLEGLLSPGPQVDEKLALVLAALTGVDGADDAEGQPKRPLLQLDLGACGYERLPGPLLRDRDRDPNRDRALDLDLDLALSALQVLALHDNRIAALPGQDLEALPRLQRLVLRKNGLQRLFPDLAASGAAPAWLRGLVHIDLRQNVLARLPSELARCCPALEEVLAAFNPIVEAEEALRALPRLRTIDLSNCRLAHFPTLSSSVLEYINVENNAITAIPPEVALRPRLRTLLVAGNPQRGVRAHVVAEGSAAVIAFLRDRCAQPGASASAAATEDGMEPHSLVDAMQAGSATPRVADAPVRASERSEHLLAGRAPPPFATAPQQDASEPRATMADLAGLLATVADLERKLANDFSLSSAQVLALKKRLAMERASMIRAQRQQQQQRE